MYAAPLIAIFQPDIFPGAALTALTLIAAIIIPMVFLFCRLGEKMAAKIPEKHS